jgi:hypothetical protein
LICARLLGSLGSPVPLCPRRFRRSWRFPPFAVHRSLTLAVSSPRELRSSSESSVSCPPAVISPPAPSLGLRSLFATLPGGVRASWLPSHVAFPSAAFLTPSTACAASRLVGLFHPTATSRVCSTGAFPHKQPRRLVVVAVVPSHRWRRFADDVATAATNRRLDLRALFRLRIRCRRFSY